MYKTPKRFFTRFLILTLLSFIIVAVSIALTGGGDFAKIVAVILVVIDYFFLLAMLVIAIINFFKYLFDRSNTNNMIMHSANLVFAILINAMFTFFYIVILAAASLILLPLMQ
jgi:hypothetical protein